MLELNSPSLSRMPAFDAEVLRAFEDFVGPDDVDVAPQGSLYDFVRTFWPVVEPTMPFVDNWHIQKICKVLEAVTRGEVTRVVINVPPGCMKSLIVSVFWPAWEWAHDPSVRFLTSSYGEDLSIRDARKTRDIIRSREYQDRWPHVRIRSDQNQKRRFDTTSGGWRLSTSVGGRGLGEHPDRIIIDDPHNVKEAISEVERQHAIDWFDGTIAMRGASRNARIVIIMQRLHEQDLAGHVLTREPEAWLHVCLPMKYEPGRMKPNAFGMDDPRSVPGELLWPQLFTPAIVASAEKTLGSFRAAGQLQQRPAPAEGGIIKRTWWKYYAPHSMPAVETIVISCDPNMKAKQLNDFAAIHVWGARGADRYLLRRTHDRWDLPELTRQVEDAYKWAREKFGPTISITTLVEKTAAGPDVIASLQRKVAGIVGITPVGDKVQRAQAVTPTIEAGNAFVPGAPNPNGLGEDTALTPLWVQEFLAACTGFPFATYDDDVDAMSQALIRLQTAGSYARAVNTPQTGAGAGRISNALAAIRERKHQTRVQEMAR